MELHGCFQKHILERVGSEGGLCEVQYWRKSRERILENERRDGGILERVWIRDGIWEKEGGRRGRNNV